MAKSLTYEYVENYINEKSNGECKLLSTEYVNSTTPLALKCKCGNVFHSNFNKLRNSLFICKNCRNELASQRYRTKLEDVIEYINNTGCEYISGEYKNNFSLLTIKCKCGNLFQKNFNLFKRGQQQCPKCGAESSRQAKFKYDIDSVREILSKKGYKLLDDKYIACNIPLRCVCSKGHETSIIFNQFLVGCSGCQTCQYEYLKIKNRKEERTSETEVLKDLRDSIKSWKKEIAGKYGYKCYLTDATKDCVVHHLYPFKNIVEDCCKELNIPLHRTFGDYTIEQYNNLKNLVISKHTLDIGILLQRKVHIKFHAIYGVSNTTIKQLNEFIENHYPRKNKITEIED